MILKIIKDELKKNNLGHIFLLALTALLYYAGTGVSVMSYYFMLKLGAIFLTIFYIGHWLSTIMTEISKYKAGRVFYDPTVSKKRK